MNKQRIIAEESESVSNDTSYTPDEIHGMIETEAYNYAVVRGFDEGHALDDWLAAERQVNGRVNDQITK